VDKFTERVIAGAKRLGASYCDCRLIDLEREDVSVVGGAPRAVVHAHQRGFGVRVIANGAWGFSSSSVVTDAEADHIVEEAVAIAHASALAKKKDVVLATVAPSQDMIPHQADVDPFTIPDSDKIGLLAEATRAMMLPGVVLARGQMQFLKERKIFASSEGSYIVQDRVESGAGVSAMAASDKGDVQIRSYPMSFSGDNAQSGWEFVEAMKLLEHAEPTAGKHWHSWLPSLVPRESRTWSLVDSNSRCKSTSHVATRPSSTGSWAWRRRLPGHHF